MKLPKNYFAHLNTATYRDYLKLLPPIKQEHTKAIIMLIFTFIALSFFGFFAINPTIATIINLQKQIDDNESVLQQLTTKMNHLSQLQQQYTFLSNDLPIIFAAIPEQANIPFLIGQIQNIAEQNALTITALRVPEVALTNGSATDTTASSFTIELETRGSYTNSMHFITALSTMNRLVTIEKIGIKKDTKQNTILLQIQARSYNKQ
jgi:Tfp pilus assembly protein PilO